MTKRKKKNWKKIGKNEAFFASQLEQKDPRNNEDQ